MDVASLNLGRQTFGHPAHRGNLPDKKEALALLDEWVSNERLKLHMKQVAALMKAWAQERLHLGEHECLLWELTGLLHDADWDKWPEKHGKVIVAWLEERHYDPDLIHGIASHGPKQFGVIPVNDLDKMIYSFDELSGFVHAVSLVRPNGYEGMEVSSVRKKMKEKSFAAQVDRQDIADAIALAGLDFDDLCHFVIKMQKDVR